MRNASEVSLLVAILAVSFAATSAKAQADADRPDGAAAPAAGPRLILLGSGYSRGRNADNGTPFRSFFSLSDGASSTYVLGGGSEPAVVTVNGPGALIRCGYSSSGGAAIEFEFVAVDAGATSGPDPRAEAVVRRLSDEFARGEPDYDRMTPCMAATARAQLEGLRERFDELGPIEEITFNERWSGRGVDSYEVEYANGSLTWMISLTSDGQTKIWMFHDL